MRIFHIVPAASWESFDGAFLTNDSLDVEGFIHCSFEEQVDGVIQRYFASAGAIAILEIDPARLTSPLVAEPSTGGEIYPHVYGPIDREAIVGSEIRQAS